MGETAEPLLELPTEPLAQTTEFNVLAIKTITGISTQLKQKVTIKVDTSTPE